MIFNADLIIKANKAFAWNKNVLKTLFPPDTFFFNVFVFL